MAKDVKDKYKFALNNSLDFITIVNRDYVYEIANDSYCKVLNKKEEEIVGKPVSDVWGKRIFTKTLKKYFDECFLGKKIQYIEKFRFGASERFMLVTYYPYQQNRSTTHALVVSRDVTEQKKTENRLKNFEYRDPLTGLFNRRSLDLILEKEISKAKRSKTEKLRAILFISLEKFARINQTYGHHIGDILLENTGLRIKTTLRNSDYVFRFEGKEMTALLTHFARNTDVAKVAQKIINNISIPYRFKGGDIQVTCCIGVSVYPDDGEERNTLIRNATSAMNEAKKQEKEFVLYNKELHQRSLERLQLENDMYKAFGQNQFVLHYQPIVDIDGKIQGCEALIRWKHPEKGLVPPMEFIPLAEETGIIVPIGKWALYGACKQMVKWAAAYDIYVSVNLSAREFESRNLVEVIEGALKNVGDLDPGRLKLEITETESMRNPDEAIEKMMNLNRKGIEIFIDDFGIGQSSLSYLKRLPAETLKIDKAFIDDIVDDPGERDYLATIIRMVKSRKKKVLAEGVSTKEQVEILRQLGCDKIQGFYFSRPLTAEKFEECLIAGGILPLNGTPAPNP